MYHLAKSLYLQMTSKEGICPSFPPLFNPLTSPEFSILLLGLDNAGKTTLLSQIKSLYLPHHPSPSQKTVPTVGQNVATLEFPDMYLKVWDIGGQQGLRGLWTSYYASCHAIVFIVDSTDIGSGLDDDAEGDGGDLASKTRSNSTEHEGRLDECKKVLEAVLSHEDTSGVPLLVLANKQDREDCVEVVRIKEGLVKGVFEGEGGGGIRDSRVLPCSALTGAGVEEAVEWIRKRVVWCREQRPGVMR
jgi:ADP-ribosylation factor related protein 1